MLYLFVVLLSIFPSLGQAADSSVKIAIIDMKQALQTVKAGKNAIAQLEKDFNERKKEIQSGEEKLKKMTDEFKKQSLVLSDQAKRERQEKLQREFMQLQELSTRANMEMQQKQQTLTEPIVKKIKGIVSDLARKRGYTLVLEKNENVVLYTELDDITVDVINQYDKQSGEGKS